MRRGASVAVGLLALLAVVILVPVVPATEYPPCPPPSPSGVTFSCGPFTYHESISFHYVGVGAVYGFCGARDGYRLADMGAGITCSNGRMAG